MSGPGRHALTIVYDATGNVMSRNGATIGGPAAKIDRTAPGPWRRLIWLPDLSRSIPSGP